MITMDDNILLKIGFDKEGKPIEKEPIFISFSEFNGKKYFDIRKYYDKDGEWKPTKKGISFKQDQLKEFKELLNDKQDEINKFFSS